MRMTDNRRRVVIVSPHFPPSNATAGHRTRLFAAHLRKYGWEPHVLAVDPRFYEEPLDWDLMRLLPADLPVSRTRALPLRPVRVVGDLGVRALLWQYCALSKLAARREIDLLFIPIPPNFSALLGPLLNWRHKVPYAIDYIDPWVHPWPEAEKRFSKAWFAYKLGQLFEPIVLRHASLVTGVAPGYYQGAFDRNPDIPPKPHVSLPYGAEIRDFSYLDEHARPVTLFDPDDGNFHVVYTGTLLPRAKEPMVAVFEAVRELMESSPDARRLRLHFIGTGNAATNDEPCVAPLAEAAGIGHLVREHPARIPYLDALNHLNRAAAVLVVGSTEPHYTASKIFPAILSGRPVVAVLHAKSSASSILAETRGCLVVAFDDRRPVGDRRGDIAAAFRALLRDGIVPDADRDAVLRTCSAENLTSSLAQAFDAILPPRELAATP